MISGLEDQNTCSASGQAGGLQCDLDRVGAGNREEDLGIFDGYLTQYLSSQLGAKRVGMDVSQAVNQPAGLLANGCDHRVMSMTDRGDAESCCQVHKAVAIDVEDVGAPCLLPGKRGAVGANRIDSWGLSMSRFARQSTRSGTRRRTENAGGKVAATERGHGSELSPSGERPGEGDLIGVFDVATHRHAESQPGHSDLVLFEESSQVKGCGLTLDIRVGGQDDLFDTVEPTQESSHPDLVGTDSPLG